MSEWKDMEDMVKRVAGQEPLPESLAPEEIEKKLRASLAAEEEQKKKSEKSHGKSGKWGRRVPFWGSVMAACLALVLVLSVVLTQNSAFSGKDGENKAGAEKKEKAAETEVLEEVLSGAANEDEIFEKIDRIQNPQKYMSVGERIINGVDNLIGAVSSGFSRVKGEKSMDMAAAPGSNGEAEESKTYGSENVVRQESADGGMQDSGGDFSETNIQEEGVGEADEVITDGKFFYIKRANENEIAIVQAEGAQMNTVSQITWPEINEKEEQHVHEFYVSGNKLVLMKTVYNYYASEEGKVLDSCREETWIEVYDISDRSAPKQISVLRQDGAYESSRMTGGYLYTFSDHYIYNTIQKDKPESYMPCADGEVIACKDIYVPDETDSAHYKVITSVKLDAPESFQTEKAVLCGSGWCYVSSNAIYFLAESYVNKTDDGYNLSEIWKFTYQDGSITGSASGTVKGAVRDQFAMSEENGYLRVVTTYGKNADNVVARGGIAVDDVAVFNDDMKNGLYILDENLNLTGSLENLAENEQIYSARFFVDTAYFVTFRQTDPLFSVDVSDPANPVLLGELKIPGFSEYLHPYGEGRLLGIGYDADENGRQTGIRLSMFDVTDPANVKEIATKVIAEFNDNASYSSPALYNHKAVLVNEEKNLIGCNLNGYIYANRRETRNNAYVIYGYDEEQGFFLKKKTELTVSRADSGRYDESYDKELNKCSEIRGAYIGNYFYTINEGYTIQCFDMENGFALLGEYEY